MSSSDLHHRGSDRRHVKSGFPNATVRLYYYETLTAPSGCFSLGGPDSRPFEFSVSAPGYKSLVVKAVRGFYRASVTLIPDGSDGESVSEFNEISRDRYTELSQVCP
jgi:hypothetical protein